MLVPWKAVRVQLRKKTFTCICQLHIIVFSSHWSFNFFLKWSLTFLFVHMTSRRVCSPWRLFLTQIWKTCRIRVFRERTREGQKESVYDGMKEVEMEQEEIFLFFMDLAVSNWTSSLLSSSCSLSRFLPTFTIELYYYS